MQRKNSRFGLIIVAVDAGDNGGTFAVLAFAGFVSGRWRFRESFPELSRPVGKNGRMHDYRK
jgi:hypothetical protein